MITCVIQYTLDPHGIEDFEKYATTWPPIIERCGGRLTGIYLPKEGANDFALALLDFDSLADYEAARLQRAQHRGPGRVRDQRGRLGEVGVVRDGLDGHGHGPTVTQACFDLYRSMAACAGAPVRSLRRR